MSQSARLLTRLGPAQVWVLLRVFPITRDAIAFVVGKASDRCGADSECEPSSNDPPNHPDPSPLPLLSSCVDSTRGLHRLVPSNHGRRSPDLDSHLPRVPRARVHRGGAVGAQVNFVAAPSRRERHLLLCRRPYPLAGDAVKEIALLHTSSMALQRRHVAEPKVVALTGPLSSWTRQKPVRDLRC